MVLRKRKHMYLKKYLKLFFLPQALLKPNFYSLKSQLPLLIVKISIKLVTRKKAHEHHIQFSKELFTL